MNGAPVTVRRQFTVTVWSLIIHQVITWCYIRIPWIVYTANILLTLRCGWGNSSKVWGMSIITGWCSLWAYGHTEWIRAIIQQGWTRIYISLVVTYVVFTNTFSTITRTTKMHKITWSTKCWLQNEKHNNMIMGFENEHIKQLTQNLKPDNRQLLLTTNK